MNGIATGLKGESKLRAVRAHRLLMYVQTLNEFMDGKATLAHVMFRAQKCIDCGLTAKIKVTIP